MYVYDEYDQQIIEDRVKQFRDQTRRYLAGELSEEEFRPCACKMAFMFNALPQCCGSPCRMAN